MFVLCIALLTASSYSQESSFSFPTFSSNPELLAFNYASKADQYDLPFLEARKKKFTNMRNGGFTMGVLGTIMFVGGIILFAGADEVEQDDTYYYSSNSNEVRKEGAGAVFGVLGIMIGLPVGVTGFILGGIGGRKVRYYDGLIYEKKQRMDVGFSPNSIKLSWRF
jgi:hypothetical protein